MRIAPSLAAAPMGHLSRVIADLETAGADYIHFDVEDGSFTPVMTLGTRIIAELRPLTRLPFDVHLMMVNPEWILPQLVEFGADRISVHYEACPYPRRVLRQIVSLGARAGLAFNPATPLPDLSWLSPWLSFVIMLTTEPEVPDCSFLPQILDRIRAHQSAASDEGLEWIVDGGVGAGNLSDIRRAGVDTVVAGRAIFKDGQISENMAAFRAAM